jgi:CRISPR-associated endonuclease/helicase Cas3
LAICNTQFDWLATVDMKPHIASLKRRAISTSDQEQAADRLGAIKSVAAASVELGPDSTSKKGKSDYIESLCDIVLSEHDETAQTLVILNRVDRAQDLYRLLRAQRAGKRDLLIHSRFRPKERAEQSRFLREEPTTDRIVISTQAIEAGVDISSRVLITELAPWSSLVQRFGRCNRYGEHNDTGGARILWIDVADDSEVALPYSCDQLANAREKIKAIKEASPRNLPATDEARPLTSVLRRKDMLELFNTDPDLSGFDVDVSDYIRDSGVPGVQVFWRDFERDPQSPTPQSRPQRAELCPISIGQSKGLQKRGAWYWDSLDGEWRRLDRDARPGMTLMLRAADGGYGPVVGFDSALKKAVPVIVQETRNPTEREFGDDRRSTARIPVMLLDHLANVAKHARDLCAAVGEEGNVAEVVRASRWHDVGKAHEVFHETMHSCAEAPDGLLAKSPCAGRHKRKFFRHEVASMLAWLGNNNWESQGDLIAYLIVAHHGKVRMSLRAMPTEKPAPDGRRFARGVWEGDTLPALSFDGERCAETALRLALMEMGEGEHGPSWAARTLKLLGEYGPFRLAWLESLVRMADWRASAAEQQQQGFRHGQ